MARTIITAVDAVADEIALAEYGAALGTTEALLEANPGLAAVGVIIPAGTVIVLPDLPARPATTAPVKLYD